MKVCMLVGTDMSHDARVWKEALTLAQAGHEVTVLAAHNDQLPPEEQRDGVHVIRVAPEPWAKPRAFEPFKSPGGNEMTIFSHSYPKPLMRTVRAWLWHLRVLAKTVSLVRALSPDVIHIHDCDRVFCGVLAHFIARKPFVYDSHEYVAGRYPRRNWRSAGWRTWYLGLERLFISRAAAVITVNNYVERKLLARYRLRRTVVVHNYPIYQKAASNGAKLRAMLPEKYRNWPLLLYQGRLTRHRGIEVFVVVLGMLPDSVGAVVGGGPIEMELKRLAQQHGLGDRLVFVPQVPWDQLAQYTPGADLGFCLSAHTVENNRLAEPNKIFEYLMAGVPVVASDFPPLRECVVGEDVGIVVPPDNPREIARAVHALLQEPDRLRAMRERALRVARSKYNWESTSAALVELYATLEKELFGHRCGQGITLAR